MRYAQPSRWISWLVVFVAFSVLTASNASCSGPDPDSGSTLGFTTYRSEPSRIGVDGSGNVYVCNQDGIKLFDSSTGRLKAQTQIRGRMFGCSFAVTSAGQVYYVANAGSRSGSDVVSLSANDDSLHQGGSLDLPGPVDESATFAVTASGTVISIADSVIDRYTRKPNGDLALAS